MRLLALFLIVGALTMHAQTPLLAIDVLIEPDSAMIANAKAINTKLRQNFPQGYALDATHLPHVTLVQRYVRASDLEDVKTAVAKVLSSEDLGSLQLTCTGYITSIWGETGIALYNVELTPQLRALEDRIVSAVQPFAVATGTADAFVRSPHEQIDPKTIQWVTEFVPVHSGSNYEPHVTLGLAHPDFLARLKQSPFKPFTFHAASVSIYQLGNVGTAQKKLAAWPVK